MPELNEQTQTVIDKLRKKNDLTSNVSFGMTFDPETRETPWIRHNDVCHGYLNDGAYAVGRDSRPEYLILDLRRKSWAETSQYHFAYWEWLFTDSPWSRPFVDQVNEFEFVICDADVPNNLLINTAIASRVPYQWPHICDTWYDLTQRGVHPNMAIWAAHLYPKRDWAVCANGDVHRVMAPGYLDPAEFLKVGPDFESKIPCESYKTSLTYTSVFKYFGNTSRNVSSSWPILLRQGEVSTVYRIDGRDYAAVLPPGMGDTQDSQVDELFTYIAKRFPEAIIK